MVLYYIYHFDVDIFELGWLLNDGDIGRPLLFVGNVNVFFLINVVCCCSGTCDLCCCCDLDFNSTDNEFCLLIEPIEPIEPSDD